MTADEKRKHRNAQSLRSYHKLKQSSEWRARRARLQYGIWVRNKYGITLDQYEAMLAEQGGGCAVCGREAYGRYRLAVDHCHETGEIRSLLCNGCNAGLGQFQDNPDLLEAASAYLRAHRRKRLRVVA